MPRGQGSPGRRRSEPVTRLEAEVTAFGESLAAHAFDPGSPGATADAVADYERALDAYEEAKRELERARGRGLLRRNRGVQDALSALDEGRYASACLDARLSGEPLPQRLPPCFFDPRHGPSVREVPWAPDGGSERMVAVCAADAVRLAEGIGPIATGRDAGRVGLPSASAPDRGNSSRRRRPPTAVVARPLPSARRSGAKPRPRGRCAWDKRVGRGLLAVFAAYLVGLLVVGDPAQALVVLLVGDKVAAIAGIVGFLTGYALLTLWRLARRGREARAEVLTWRTLGLVLGVLVGLPVFVAAAAATLYLIPGLLILALLR